VPVTAPERPSTTSRAYATYAVAFVILLALAVAVVGRRWRIGREDRRTYGS
jgi:hypothetical protein